MMKSRKHPIRVVVIEDDHDFRDLVVQKLCRAGFTAAGVRDGHQLAKYLGTAELKNQRPDLVISDIRLPGLDGLTLLRSIRSSRWTVPVILMTGFNGDDVASRAAQLNAVAVLSKPFDLDELVAIAGSVAGVPPGLADGLADERESV